MQYLKEDIRDKIIDAALEEFVVKDYSGASMRSIAENADITVGNIYRYFKSKEDLLDQCLRPLLNVLEIFIMTDHASEAQNEAEMLVRERIAKNIVRIYQKFPREFHVLRYGLKNTCYNAYYEDLIKAVMEKIKRVTTSRQIDVHPMLFEVVARNQIDSVIYILEHVKKEEAENVINQFFALNFEMAKENF